MELDVIFGQVIAMLVGTYVLTLMRRIGRRRRRRTGVKSTNDLRLTFAMALMVYMVVLEAVWFALTFIYPLNPTDPFWLAVYGWFLPAGVALFALSAIAIGIWGYAEDRRHQRVSSSANN